MYSSCCRKKLQIAKIVAIKLFLATLRKLQQQQRNFIEGREARNINDTSAFFYEYMRSAQSIPGCLETVICHGSTAITDPNETVLQWNHPLVGDTELRQSFQIFIDQRMSMTTHNVIGY